MKLYFKFLLLFIVGLIIFKLIRPYIILTFNNNSQNHSTSVTNWLEDLEQLRTELPKKHINLYQNITKENFNLLIDNLEKDLNSLSVSEIKIRIMEIIASVKDSHTYARCTFSKKYFPIETCWFSDGLYIIGTSQKYKHIRGSKILEINKIPIEEAVRRINKAISFENEQWARVNQPEILKIPEVLEYYGLSTKEELRLTVNNMENKIVNVSIKPVEDIRIAGVDLETKIDNLKPNKMSIYSEKDKEFWYQVIETEKTIYVQFNDCVLFDKNFRYWGSFVNEVIKTINDKNIEKLVIDMRYNTGGLYYPFNNMVDKIKKIEAINKKGHLFIIIGKRTFSSALLYAMDFKKNTEAIFVGEPTGGKPNGFGDMRNFRLKNSKINISYSSKYFETIPNENSLYLLPDYNIETNFLDYLNGKDPVLEFIYRY